MANPDKKKLRSIMLNDTSIKGEIVNEPTDLEKQYKIDEDGIIIFEPLEPEILLNNTIPLLIKIAQKTGKIIKFKHYNKGVYVNSKSTLQEIRNICDKIFYSQKGG